MIFKILLLFIGTIVSFWISSICGGGASLILIPLLNLLLPTTMIPFSLTIGTISSSASRIIVFRKYINWKIFYWFVPFSIPAVILGAWLIKYINPFYLQFIVALILIANIPQLFKSKKAEDESEKPYPKFILAIIGFVAGFVSGITGAIGLLFNRFYLKYGMSKEQIIATRAANEIFLHCIKLVIYILVGLYTVNAIYIGITIAVASVISSYTTKYILPYISEYVFKKLGYSAMVVSGVILLINTSVTIAHQNNFKLQSKDIGKNEETTIRWRQSTLVLEYSIDNGLEVEKQILPNALPEKIKGTYDSLAVQYEKVIIEEVFKFRKARSYEFYCYHNGKLIEKFDAD